MKIILYRLLKIIVPTLLILIFIFPYTFWIVLIETITYTAPPILKLFMGERGYIIWVIQNDKKEYPLFPLLARELCNTSDELKSDRIIAEMSIKENGSSIKCVSTELKKDRNLARLALMEGGSSLRYLDAELQDDKEIVSLSFENWSGISAIQFASQRLRDDREIALLACSKEPVSTLYHLSKGLREDKDVVIKCLEHQKGDGFKYISNNLKNDRDVVYAAIKITAWNIQSTPLMYKKEFILDALNVNPEIYNYIYDNLKNDEDIKLRYNSIVSK